MDESTTMQPANKGPKACTTCAKAKARCIPGADGASKCERCQRLGKECFSRPPAPPRTKKVPKRSRVAELEKRLDELSSQFEGAAQTTPGSNPETEASCTNVPAPSKKSANASCCERTNMLGHWFPSPSSEDTMDASAWSPEGLEEWDGLWPLPSEAGILLLQFHDVFEPLLPFVVVPKYLTAAELRQQRPFLWKAVMMVSCLFDGPRQLKLGRELLAEVGRAAVLDGLKSLDLLQGLLLMIGWFNYAIRSAQLNNLLFLARSMCVNLSLTTCQAMSEEVKFGELEHIRAYAGTYYLNTLVFTTNKKTDAFMNTSQLETFCRVLEASAEYPSDEYLVKLVRIQLLAQSISLTMSFDPTQPSTGLPLTIVVQSFQQQIDLYRESLPAHLINNRTLKCHMAIAEILLLDVAITDQHCNSTIMPLTDRLQLLWACVGSLRTFFAVRCCEDRFCHRPRFLCLSASDMAYSIITAIKLLLVRLPGWSPKGIVAEMALREMLDNMVNEMDELVARRRGGLLSRAEVEDDPMDRLRRLLKNAKELVDFQLQRLELGGGEVVKDAGQGWVDDDVWQDFVNDTVWNVNGDVLLMDTSI